MFGSSSTTRISARPKAGASAAQARGRSLRTVLDGETKNAGQDGVGGAASADRRREKRPYRALQCKPFVMMAMIFAPSPCSEENQGCITTRP
jgi:hypothetical protein